MARYDVQQENSNILAAIHDQSLGSKRLDVLGDFDGPLVFQTKINSAQRIVLGFMQMAGLTFDGAGLRTGVA